MINDIEGKKEGVAEIGCKAVIGRRLKGKKVDSRRRLSTDEVTIRLGEFQSE